MKKIKIGMTVLMVALVCGSAGFWWGKMSDPQGSRRQGQLITADPRDTGASADPSQHALLHEILAAIKAMREQVTTLNDQQDALGEQINTFNDKQDSLAQQVNTLSDQQIVLFGQYEALFADMQKTGANQPDAAENFEQHALFAGDSPITTLEGFQTWIEQQQTMQQTPEVQERRLMEKLEDVEWTDSLDPDAPPSDG